MSHSPPPGSDNKATAPDYQSARYESSLGISGRVARAFLSSKLTPLLVITSLLMGAFSVLVTPREEEPQIKVPMIDVFVGMPGSAAREVEQQVVAPLERAIAEIENVEYVYSTSQPSQGLIVARFLVGTDPDEAVVRIHAKIAEIAPTLPPAAMAPVVAPRSIDDVPVVAYTLWSRDTSPVILRQVALEVKTELARHPEVARITVLGGQRRVVAVRVDRERLAAHGASLLRVHRALAGLDRRLPAGRFSSADTETEVEVGSFFRSAEEVEAAVVGTFEERPVFLRDVAEVIDGPDEPRDYLWMMAGAAGAAKGLPEGVDAPAVTLAVAKKPGTNAVDLVAELDLRLAALAGPVIPTDVVVTKTRDYGFTADEKSSELIKHLWIATLAVVALMALALGRREAIVVLVAVPSTLALTLAASYLFGYTLNRVTLFALIFAIGILVDDAIVVVENIHRHYRLGRVHPRLATAYATDEVGNPTILATFAVVAALLPLAFVSGLMGPYMRPIPVNASAAMVFSLLVAFVVSPWLTHLLFRKQAVEWAAQAGSGRDDEKEKETRIHRLYTGIVGPLIERPWRRWAVLGVVGALLLFSLALLPLGVVTVKMLPFDNKSEVQVVIDMPEGSTLEQTAAVARRLGARARQLPEVTDVEVYAGTSAPFNFNGLVRHYFLRSGPLVADLQVNLLPKHQRDRTSHAFAKELRKLLAPEVEGTEANIKITEVPPGPPVLSTLVAEIYGPDLDRRVALALQVRSIFEATSGVVDTDWLVEDPGPRIDLEVDRTKASRLGVSPEAIARTVRIALDGSDSAFLHADRAREAIPVSMRLIREQRSSLDGLLAISVHGAGGQLVPLRELVKAQSTDSERFIYHKNLRPVTYVVGEVAGTRESPIYAILDMQNKVDRLLGPSGRPLQVLWSGMPVDATAYSLKWDGEWQITRDVFRDMGIAFAVVLVLIYVLVVGWFRSFVTPLIIMAPIPLTLIGILPAHGFGGVFFTATSMIGFIALAGIIVRNSILLVDFIKLELAAGNPLEKAVVKAGVVRFRPIALTAAALVVGGLVILLDPIFQGLAVALISGVLVSTALTLVLIPLLYFMYVKTAGIDRVAPSNEEAGDAFEAAVPVQNHRKEIPHA